MKELPVLETVAGECDRAAVSFLQTGFWGAFKSSFGWRPQHFLIGNEKEPLLVLERRLARGVSFAYLPRGPIANVAESERTEYLVALAVALKPLLSRDCVFLRFDPPWYTEETDSIPETLDRPCLGRPLRRATMDIQPPDTTTLALADRSDEELLAGMKPKWRYNIRLAEKKGVAVAVESGHEAVDTFYDLYRTTAERDKIALHPKAYYERLLDMASGYDGPAPDLRLWIARFEGKPIAAIVTSFRKTEAVYLYGASSDEERNRMPAYALQWAAIRAARDAGCSYYDFYGIPPRQDSHHAMAGLYRFKTGFGGKVLHYAGSWDYALSPMLYLGYRTAEAVRNYWFKTVRKRFRREATDHESARERG